MIYYNKSFLNNIFEYQKKILRKILTINEQTSSPKNTFSSILANIKRE
jgi:hypothetical protein